MEINKFVGQKIRDNRKRIGMSQTELGSILKVNQNTVSGYENGEWEISYHGLYKLSKLFDIKIDDFFPREDAEKRNPVNKDLDSQFLNLIHQILDVSIKLDRDAKINLIKNVQSVVNKYKDN